MSPQQCNGWLAVGMVAPAIQMAAMGSWWGTLLAGAIGLGLCELVGWIYRNGIPRWMWVINFGWNTLMLHICLEWIHGCWFGGETKQAVALILLAIAWISARRGAEETARTGNVLLWLTGGIYLVMLLAGVKDAKWENITLTTGQVNLPVIAVFAVPAVATQLDVHRNWNWRRTSCCVLAIAVMVAFVAGGKETTEKTAFLRWVQRLEIGSVLRRFEAVVSVALSMGWFALLGLMLSASGTAMRGICPDWYRAGTTVSAAIAGGGLICNVSWIAIGAIAFGAGIIGYVVPFLKKQKKVKKGVDKKGNE